VERGEVDRGSAVEHGLEVADVDGDDGRRERVAEAALREATLDGRLATLEVLLVDVALRARFLALLTTARRLAVARTGAATDALALLVRAFGGLKLRQDIHGCLLLVRVDLIHLEQVDDLLDHAAERGRVRHDHDRAGAAQAEALDDLLLLLVATDGADLLAHLEERLEAHWLPPSGFAGAAGVAAATAAAGAIEARCRVTTPAWRDWYPS
jgi:hypothetical protein